MKRLPAIVVLACAALLVLGACYTVPETGRRAINFMPIEQEVALGASAFSTYKSEKKISGDLEMNASVQRVGRRISRAVGDALPKAEWEFVVFEDDSPNAFALPGGKVGVHTGLFKIAHTDDELAVVMGHEVAHVIARHGAERMSQAALVAVGGVLLEASQHDKEAAERNRWLAAYGAAATVGVILPFSRLNESEADEIGLRYAARAGYDPRAALTFWGRMKEAAEGKSKPPEWISTHPSDDTRIKKLQAFMPKALEELEQAKKRAAEPASQPPAPAAAK